MIWAQAANQAPQGVNWATVVVSLVASIVSSGTTAVIAFALTRAGDHRRWLRDERFKVYSAHAGLLNQWADDTVDARVKMALADSDDRRIYEIQDILSGLEPLLADTQRSVATCGLVAPKGGPVMEAMAKHSRALVDLVFFSDILPPNETVGERAEHLREYNETEEHLRKEVIMAIRTELGVK